METFIDIGDTIEGEAVDCSGRDIRPKGMKKHPVLNKNMNIYTTDLNSSAIVRKAGIEPEDEQLKKKTAHFHRQKDDRISCDAMTIYTDKPSLKIEVMHGKECASSQHGTMYANCNRHTIATVKVPLPNLMKKLGYSSNCITDKTKEQ